MTLQALDALTNTINEANAGKNSLMDNMGISDMDMEFIAQQMNAIEPSAPVQPALYSLLETLPILETIAAFAVCYVLSIIVRAIFPNWKQALNNFSFRKV